MKTNKKHLHGNNKQDQNRCTKAATTNSKSFYNEISRKLPGNFDMCYSKGKSSLHFIWVIKQVHCSDFPKQKMDF